jgi:hypothetical protein
LPFGHCHPEISAAAKAQLATGAAIVVHPAPGTDSAFEIVRVLDRAGLLTRIRAHVAEYGPYGRCHVWYGPCQSYGTHKLCAHGQNDTRYGCTATGPGFVAGLRQLGISLFIWGAVATSVPLIVAVLLGHYVFKFHPAILFGVCAGVRTTTAALGMIQDAARSKVPALGYGMPYAIGNTLLTIFGMAVVLLTGGIR